MHSALWRGKLDKVASEYFKGGRVKVAADLFNRGIGKPVEELGCYKGQPSTANQGVVNLADQS